MGRRVVDVADLEPRPNVAAVEDQPADHAGERRRDRPIGDSAEHVVFVDQVADRHRPTDGAVGRSAHHAFGTTPTDHARRARVGLGRTGPEHPAEPRPAHRLDAPRGSRRPP